MSTPSFRSTRDSGERETALASAPLPHLGVLQLAGPGAIDFLQGQVSHDTRRLAAGAPLLAAYSNAQGRVIAVLHLLPHSSGVLAVLPRDVLAATAERLRKFVLRAKVKIEDASQRFAVIGIEDAAALAAAGLEAPDQRGYLERDGIGVAQLGPAGAAPATASEGAPAAASTGRASIRFWVVRETPSPPQSPDPEVERSWRLADIRAGLPTVYAATSEVFVAQMLNLDLLDGISFSKGCYTGQEIIARTQNLGRIKRRMFRLRLPAGDWSIGQPLRLVDGRAGRITELASSGEGFEALAVLTLEASASDADGASGDAVSAAELPLPYRVSGL